MVQVLEANNYKRPSVGQRLSGGVGQALQQASQMYQQHQEKQKRNEAFKQITGMEGEGFDPDTQKMIIQLKLQGKNQEALELIKQKEGLTPLQQSQLELNEQKIKNYKEQNQLFGDFFNPNVSEGMAQKLTGTSQKQQFPGIEKPQTEAQTKEESQVNPQDPKTWPEETLTKMAGWAGQPGKPGIVGNIAQNELDRRAAATKAETEEFKAEREYHTSFSRKARDEVEALRSSMPGKRMALDYARNAVESGEVGAFSLANLGARLGVKELQTAKGAQLELAAKEHLFNNIGRVSAKAQNLYMEQRLLSMLPQIGKSEEANLTAQEMLEAEEMMGESYLKAYDRISSEDIKKYGYEKMDIKKRALDEARSDDKEIMKRTAYRTKQLEEKEMGLTKMKEKVGKDVPKGTPLTLGMAKLYQEKFGKENAAAVAKKNGYYIPPREELENYLLPSQEYRARFE